MSMLPCTRAVVYIQFFVSHMRTSFTLVAKRNLTSCEVIDLIGGQICEEIFVHFYTSQHEETCIMLKRISSGIR